MAYTLYNTGACPPTLSAQAVDMRVRLTRRLANRFNGVELSRHRVGHLLDLPQRDAEMLVSS
jgi:hypothetical protein